MCAPPGVYVQVLLVQHQTPGDREPFGYPFDILVEVKLQHSAAENDNKGHSGAL